MPHKDPVPPKVVFALQAPTLLNILAKSPRWRMFVADMGDCRGIAEASLLDAPKWDGLSEGIRAVFVCTPDQRRMAETTFPNAEIVWVAHNGRQQILNLPESQCEHYLTFSHRVQHMVESYLSEAANVRVIVPHYKPAPQWKWAKDVSFTFNNRPKTREPDAADMMKQVLDRAGVTDHRVYGQDQPLGFATPEVRAKLYAASSCYLSALPNWAGFGLAQHECLAAGVPLVANTWGDFGFEEPLLPGVHSNLPMVAHHLKRVRESKAVAQTLSVAGMDFISARRKMSRMNDGITNLLDSLYL